MRNGEVPPVKSCLVGMNRDSGGINWERIGLICVLGLPEPLQLPHSGNRDEGLLLDVKV
jgi:hypothetical protein